MTRYYTADGANGPWLVWRDDSPDGTTWAWDPAIRDWVPVGWVAKYTHGHDLNYSDLDPADLDAMLARMTVSPGLTGA